MKALPQTYPDRMIAEVVISLLRASGIEAHLSADDSAGLYASLNVDSGVKILVADEQWDEAVALLTATPE